jgi:hypothetical protein
VTKLNVHGCQRAARRKEVSRGPLVQDLKELGRRKKIWLWTEGCGGDSCFDVLTCIDRTKPKIKIKIKALFD